MLTKITNILMRLVAIFALIAGFGYLGSALAGVSGYDLADASAIQVTQVYAELTYLGVTAGVLFLLAFLMEYLVNNSGTSSIERLEQTNYLLQQIGRVLSSK